MSEIGGQVIPPYMIAGKEAVKERAEPVWTRRKNLPNMTESYHNYMTNVRLGSGTPLIRTLLGQKKAS